MPAKSLAKSIIVTPNLKPNNITGNSPDFSFSENEATTIKAIWESLGIVKVVKTLPPKKEEQLSRVSTTTSVKVSTSSDRESARSKSSSDHRQIRSKPSVDQLKPKTTEKPQQQFAFDDLDGFQYKLCANILKYEVNFRDQLKYSDKLFYNNTTMLSIDSEIEKEELETIKATYQTESMIQMLTFTIYNLMNITESWYSTITKFARINSRIWDIGQFQYTIIGESMILTIIEHLGRAKFPSDLEAVWLKFFNKLMNVLLYRSQELMFDTPIIHNYHTTHISPKHESNFLHQLKLNRSTNLNKLMTINDTFNSRIYSHNSQNSQDSMSSVNSISISSGDDSTRSGSSVLSLKLEDHETSSISTIEQSPKKPERKMSSHSTLLNDSDIEYTSSSNEDESYDYLNSFDDHTRSKTKHKSMFRLKGKKSNKSLHSAFSATKTSPSTIVEHENRLSKMVSQTSTLHERKGKEDCVIS